MTRDPVSDSGREFRPYESLFGRWSVAASIIVLAGAALMPADGIGMRVCGWQAMSGHDCPGCGLSRSVRNLAHGDPSLAFSYHPFGLIVLPYAVITASTLLWPRSLRRRVRAHMDRHTAGVLRTGKVLIALFLLFGVTRLALSLLAS